MGRAVPPVAHDASACAGPGSTAFGLPFGRMVMTLPLLSQLGEPFQVATVFCGGVTVTVVDQPVIGELPAVMVTLPLKRSLHCCCLLYVAVHVAPPGVPLERHECLSVMPQTVMPVQRVTARHALTTSP